MYRREVRPPEERVSVFELSGIPTEIAIAGSDSSAAVYLAQGTFPQLADHPLHDAFYGLPTRPDYRSDCGPTFTLTGEVSGVDFNLRAKVDEAEGPGQALEGDETWLELDVRSRVVGFDRKGLPTLEPGQRVRVRAQYCKMAEADWPVAVSIEPAG